MLILSDNIVVRDFELGDVPLLVDYWYRSDRSLLEKMGVDLAKLRSEDEFKLLLIEETKNPKTTHLVVLYQDRPIGVHLVNQFKSDGTAVFHAHIWATEMRGMGIGTISYIKACQIFFGRFGLKKIIFKTPVQNIAALRIKEKMGLKSLKGRTNIGGTGVLSKDVVGEVFELKPDDLINRVRL